jgi:hypothetical protein
MELMSKRDNVSGCVNIAVVSDTALTAGQFSYTQPIDALWPCQGTAGRTGTDGVRLVYFLENNTCVSAFVSHIVFSMPSQHPALTWPLWFR